MEYIIILIASGLTCLSIIGITTALSMSNSITSQKEFELGETKYICTKTQEKKFIKVEK